MADIVSAAQKINDIEVSQDAPITEALMNKIGGNINYLLDKNTPTVEFTSSGTWTCPAGITKISILACGGGASGAIDHTNVEASGGRAAKESIRTFTVVPNSNYLIEIGAGGAAKVSTGSGPGGGYYQGFGNAGGNTVFKDAGGTPIYTWLGARTSIADNYTMTDVDSANFSGGATHYAGGASGYAYGGHAGPFGVGGNGAGGNGAVAGSAPANSGAGGGAVTTDSTSGFTYTSGAGGSGRLIIF